MTLGVTDGGGPRLRAVTTDRHALREVVDSPGFRGLLSVRLTGQLADGLFQGALISSTFFNPEKVTTAGDAALIFTATLLPYSLVGPFAGVFLDRWRRQRVLVVANFARSGMLVVLAPLVAAFGASAAVSVGVALIAVSANRFVLAG